MPCRIPAPECGGRRGPSKKERSVARYALAGEQFAAWLLFGSRREPQNRRQKGGLNRERIQQLRCKIRISVAGPMFAWVGQRRTQGLRYLL